MKKMNASTCSRASIQTMRKTATRWTITKKHFNTSRRLGRTFRTLKIKNLKKTSAVRRMNEKLKRLALLNSERLRGRMNFLHPKKICPRRIATQVMQKTKKKDRNHFKNLIARKISQMNQMKKIKKKNKNHLKNL